MADYFTEDIIVNILHRSHVKTLVRCTCVSKSWYSLITSPQFVSSHLKFNSLRNKGPPLLLLRRLLRDSERYSLHLDDEFISLRYILKFPFKSVNSCFSIIGSCNGLLCLSDDRVFYMHNLIIWNPTIRKSILLPKPNLIYNCYGPLVQCLGFGFDRLSDDYKLVRIAYSGKDAQVEIYRLSAGKWRDLSSLPPQSVIYNRSRHAYFNGASHWIARNIWGNDLILAFNMCSEVFVEMKMPQDWENLGSCSNGDLVVYRDSLSLVSWNFSGCEPGFCLWVMKEYGISHSWMKCINILIHDVRGIPVRPLWVTKSNGILIIRKDGHLISYNHDEEAVEDLGIHGSKSEESLRCVHVDVFVESLVLLGRSSALEDKVTCKMLPILRG